MPRRLLVLSRGLLGLIAFTLMTIPTSARAQVPADQAADLLLNSARKAANEQNYPFAVGKFREFIQKYGNSPQIDSARYGLAIALIESPERDFTNAINELNPLAGKPQFPEHAYVLYHLGLAQRGLGINELAQGLARPPEMPQRRNNAMPKFTEALKHFTAATTAFTAKLPKELAADAPVPAEIDWAARARCDQAEMELRLNQPKLARATAEPFVADPILIKSRYRGLGLYAHGVACFQLNDMPAAGKSLSLLAPFEDPATALHARYLLGRVHHAADELAEATTQFDAVVAGYEAQKKAAVESLKQPDRFKNNPYELGRLQALVSAQPPEYVAGAMLELGCLQYEAGKFAEAQTRFAEFIKLFPQAPQAAEAQLRLGFCQVQQKLFPEATATLTPLTNHPKLADQATYWLGKTQIGLALAMDPLKVAERDQALKASLTTLRSASDKTAQIGGMDPDARKRRGEILLQLADTHQLAKLPKEAAQVYEQIINEKLLPERPEEVVHRYAVALHLAGDFAKSDQVCQKFQMDFPQSTLLPAILFRTAENAYFVALTAKAKPDLANREVELPKLFDEATKRYTTTLEKFPEFDQTPIVRFGLAMCAFHVGNYEKAGEFLDKIPAPDRSGDLATTPYLLAECLIRQTPINAGEDALADNMISEKLTNARGLLEGFIAANPKAPEAPDALIKLGYCMRRLALREQPQERNNGLNLTRGVYEKVIQQYPTDPLMPLAQFERAKTIALTGDRGNAINELRKFAADPLAATLVAPMAVIQLATYLREENKAPEAVVLFTNLRPRFEQLLGQQKPPRAEEIGLVRYHHGVALQESAKFPEARQIFDSVPQAIAGKPITAEALLRSGQCRLQDGRLIVDKFRAELAKPGLKPDQLEPIRKQMADGFNAVREAAQSLEKRAEEFKAALPTSEIRARMLYESAWAYRMLSDDEVATTRNRMQQEQHRKLVEDAKAKTPMNATPPIVPLPEIARTAIPLQPAETKMRAMYQAVIDGFADLELAVETRFELGEVLAEREETEPAVKLLKEALDKEPTDKPTPPELLDKVRIRLGCTLMDRKENEAALAQFDIVSQNPKSTMAAQAHYRAGECLMVLGDFAKAATRLSVFRDKGEFHNVAGLSDRALLQLGQAYAQAKQWDPSRQAYETLVGRFGGSPWVNEARFGMAWASQSKGDFEGAVNTYNQVIAATTTELAAKSHLQIGLCRLEQKRYAEAATSLLVVPYTYDFPALNPIALTEAARALIADKQTTIAERLLQRVLKESPNSEWAKIAKERLDALQPAAPTAP